ncbi:MAG: SurA N-terminal domain-containing protein, partial [Synergistaceae bacterium]|nr:SurA N-terminal domain-containing protein [Synergistaceae bacterium]
MMKFLRTQMKWIMAIIVVAFLLSTFLMYEGRGTRRTPSRNPDGSMADYEVAQINGRSLMRSELEQRLRSYLSTYSTRSVVSIDMPAIYRAVLDEAILESQLAKEVQEKGITVSDAEADAAMKNYADTYFPTREAFYQLLAQSGMKPEDYRRTLARSMAADKLRRSEIGEVTISEDKAVEYYDTMKGIMYSRPEGFMLHLADFRTSADAEYFRDMIAGGESWDVIASGDALASRDVINITKSPVMLPASAFKIGVLSVLDSLDVGAVSPVFEVGSGDYAVAVKTSHVEAATTPYSELSRDIRNLLIQQEERIRILAYEAALRQKANVVINDEELFASTVTSNDEEQSGDIFPIVSVEEVSSDESPVSEDKPAETPAAVEPTSEDTTAETPAVEPVSEDKPAETPVVEPVSEDTTAETPAVEPVSEDTTAETPAAVEPVSEDTTAETPAVEPVSEDTTAETPAAVEPVSEDTTAETPAVE